MHILFGKRRSSKEQPKPTPMLSPNFAEQVIDLEEQINLNCTLPTVTRLIGLYTKAIEFYEAEKNLKHIHYQERMQSLLSRTNVIQLFKTTQNPLPQVKPVLQISPKSASNSHSFEEKRTNSDLAVERTCEKVLKELVIENSHTFKKIQDNLKNQSDGLNQRLISRKQSQTPKYKGKFVFEETNQCDISAGEAKNNPVEEFENEVEGIMEKYIEEKVIEKQRVHEKYEEYFTETRMMRGRYRDWCRIRGWKVEREIKRLV